MSLPNLTYCFRLLLLTFIFLSAIHTDAFARKHAKISFRDSLDHCFDLSNWVLINKGFIPVPYIITEPALGNFGIAIAPIFIRKNQPIVNKKTGELTPIPPNVTTAAAGYTANKTWLLGAGRIAGISKWGIQYKIMGAFTNINMNFYHSFPLIGEQRFEFNFRGFPAYASIAKHLWNPQFSAGIDYLFLSTEVKMANDDPLPSFVEDKEKNSIVSQFGLIANFDSRDNIFTPDRGIKIHADLNLSDYGLGSDYHYGRMNAHIYSYTPIRKNWICGLRLEMQQVLSGRPPFFLLPYIAMRGIPAVRYQGNIDWLIETDQRWDFVPRWSAVVFGGLGKAFNSYNEFGDAPLAYGYGLGFRYLVARRLKLRMGIDIAHGPDQFAWYIVFGSSWFK